MQQYFVKGRAENPIIITDKDTIKHMFSVMRLAEADEVVLVFDDGIKRLARVQDAAAHQFELVAELDSQVELPVQVTIAMGFPKGDKLELITQKATELGADRIWAYPADWSVVKWDSKKLAKRAEKLEKIALGAAEQSKRNRIPEVTLFAQKSDFLDTFSEFDQVLVAYEEVAKAGEQGELAKSFKELKLGQKLLLIFGPEGGLSPDEVDRFVNLDAKLVGLGPRILRAETAPLYALSTLSFYLELNIED